MTKYVAFLRGVNVGGRTLKMAELKTCLESSGLSDVKTFIQSGNVVFSDQRGAIGLTNLIEKAIEKRFGMAVSVIVLDFNQMGKLVRAIPSDWVNDKQSKCDVMLLWPGIDRKDILEDLPYNPKIEEVRYVPGAVMWRINRNLAGKSRMFKIVGTKIYKQMTVRNPNTVRKIYALMSQ